MKINELRTRVDKLEEMLTPLSCRILIEELLISIDKLKMMDIPKFRKRIHFRKSYMNLIDYLKKGSFTGQGQIFFQSLYSSIARGMKSYLANGMKMEAILDRVRDAYDLLSNKIHETAFLNKSKCFVLNQPIMTDFMKTIYSLTEIGSLN
jgi:hypothetical protein